MLAFAWRVSKLMVKWCTMHLSVVFFPFHPLLLPIHLKLLLRLSISVVPNEIRFIAAMETTPVIQYLQVFAELLFTDR